MVDLQKKVIVADDHVTSAMFQTIVLRRIGYEVLPAMDGFEVLQQMAANTPDLVLISSQLNDPGGLETLKAIRGKEEFSDVPVVMVAEKFSDEARRSYNKAGCSGFLTKPITLKKLNIILQQMVHYERQSRQKLRIPFNKWVEVQFEGAWKKFFALSLSEGGIYLRASHPLPVKSELAIRLELICGTVLELTGTVLYHQDVYQADPQKDPGMAVGFLEVGPADLEALNRHIATILIGDLVEDQDEKVLAIDG